jgi:hypothetical protein
MGKKVKGHIIIRNVDTINPNQKDEKEMVNFFLKLLGRKEFSHRVHSHLAS